MCTQSGQTGSHAAAMLGLETRDSLGAAVGSRLLLSLLDFMLVELIVALPPRCECVVVVAAAVADGT